MIPVKVTDTKQFVHAASPIGIEYQLRTVATRMRRWKRWLNSGHKYNSDVVGTLKKRDIDAPKLGEYIACSAPLHLADGWNYLSRAFDAASRGDRSTAFHLAYYAELRAAMSLLAAEGIGIFNQRHIALDANLQPMEFKGSTHAVTWSMLSSWSNETGKAAKLLEAITIESKSLSKWLEAVGAVDAAQQLVASKWLRAWSVDLQIFAADQDRRNEMSYRPTRIRVPAPQPVNPLLELVAPIFDSWSELEPIVSGTCAALDLSLLRQALLLVVKEGVCHYSSFGKALRSLEGAMPSHIFQALKSKKTSAVTIFRNAEISNIRGRTATPILARGLLMLRLASASTASLLASAEVSKSDLEFWWSPLGKDLGLWDAAADIESFSDLWSDVAEAKDKADARLSAIQGEESVQAVAGILAQDLSLTQFSRAPMWLLGLD